MVRIRKKQSMSEDSNALPGLKPSQNEWSELEKNKSMSEYSNALPGLKPSHDEPNLEPDPKPLPEINPDDLEEIVINGITYVAPKSELYKYTNTKAEKINSNYINSNELKGRGRHR